MDCEHDVRQEVSTGLIHAQRCKKCGYVREYNPKDKKTLTTTDPDMWSEWSPSSPIIDKLFK